MNYNLDYSAMAAAAAAHHSMHPGYYQTLDLTSRTQGNESHPGPCPMDGKSWLHNMQVMHYDLMVKTLHAGIAYCVWWSGRLKVKPSRKDILEEMPLFAGLYHLYWNTVFSELQVLQPCCSHGNYSPIGSVVVLLILSSPMSTCPHAVLYLTDPCFSAFSSAPTPDNTRKRKMGGTRATEWVSDITSNLTCICMCTLVLKCKQ